jgi:hypothetical protein
MSLASISSGISGSSGGSSTTSSDASGETHLPPMQVSPPGQIVPQVPQLFSSVCLSVQPEGQQSTGQVSAHSPQVQPALHVLVPGQEVPETVQEPLLPVGKHSTVHSDHVQESVHVLVPLQVLEG